MSEASMHSMERLSLPEALGVGVGAVWSAVCLGPLQRRAVLPRRKGADLSELAGSSPQLSSVLKP